jgi:asparagine synthetase B (glutamine-hydrolysing)
MDSGFLVQMIAQPGPIGPVSIFRSNEGTVFEGRTLSGFVKPFPVTPETMAETQPLISPHTVLLYQGHIDNRAELARALGSHELMAAPDGTVLLAAVEKWGHGLQQHVAGDYSFVALDRANSTVIAGRDALGVKRVYYHASEDRLAVSSSVRLLLAALDSTPSLESEGIAEFIRCGELAATFGRNRR